jgi:hypothetical protein
MTTLGAWSVSGSYYEVCNCEAICPCRRQGGAAGGKQTYEECDFALSWWVKRGHAGALDLVDMKVVMTGRWMRDVKVPWTVALYVDERATQEQKDALAAIFLGKAGGPMATSYAANIGDVIAVKSASIELDHTSNAEKIEISPLLIVKTKEPVKHDFTVSCGIPGHDHPGQEIRAEVFRYADHGFDWEFRGKCGFATDFAYAS